MNANEMMQELRDGQQFRLKANHNITLRRAYDGAYEMVYPVAFACCAKHMSSMGQDDRIYFANQMCGTISFMITVDKWEAIE